MASSWKILKDFTSTGLSIGWYVGDGQKQETCWNYKKPFCHEQGSKTNEAWHIQSTLRCYSRSSKIIWRIAATGTCKCTPELYTMYMMYASISFLYGSCWLISPSTVKSESSTHVLPIPDHLVSCLDAIAGKASFNTVSAKQKCALSLGKQELPWTEHSKGASWDHSMPYPTGFFVASTTSVAVRSLHALASVPKSLPKSNQTSSVCIISHWWVSCLYQINSNTISSHIIILYTSWPRLVLGFDRFQYLTKISRNTVFKAHQSACTAHSSRCM